jgi:protein lifeguard
MVSLGFICLFVYNDSANLWVRRNPGVMMVAFVVMIITLLSMACCEGVRRKTPMNFIFLGIFTIAQSFMLATVSASYKSNEVVLAVAITAGICFALTLFAFQTKWDFTVMGGILFVAAIILLVFGFVAMIWPGKIITMLYASAGALIFSVYLIYDTQMMMGGKHKYSISPEEYVFAALNLYLDIVNIFLYILTIIGASRD